MRRRSTATYRGLALDLPRFGGSLENRMRSPLEVSPGDVQGQLTGDLRIERLARISLAETDRRHASAFREMLHLML
jgi:2,4-dienoyl-CoA reductase-like NADH-dependent reductase (Old Yellow Enzyme family)